MHQKNAPVLGSGREPNLYKFNIYLNQLESGGGGGVNPSLQQQKYMVFTRAYFFYRSGA